MDIEEAKKTYLDGDFKLKGEFQGSNYAREEVLTRAERYAGWTLPSVFPDDPLMEYDELQQDYQSVGAKATTNLANKMMMALFQPSKPFFRLQITDEQREDAQNAAKITSAQVDAGLAQSERDAMLELSKIGARVKLNDAMLHLIITGNTLVQIPSADDEKTQVYSLRDYIIQRDIKGSFNKIIIRDTQLVQGLTDDLRALATGAGYSDKDEVELFTGVQRVGGRFMIWQELEDLCYCHDKVGWVTEDTLEYIPLVWKLARGKDYGTGLVEDYAGDFHVLSTTAEAVLDFTTVCTDVKNLVNPTGMTNVQEITSTPSGGYCQGRESDLFAYTAADKLGNSADFLDRQYDKRERSISAAFLMNTAVVRDAERVTAEEIRMLAQELESSLGGIYSRLANDLQLPLAIRLLSRMDPAFSDLEPIITTGLESLSRNSDLGNMRAFLADLAQLEGLPDAVKVRIKMGDLIASLGAGHGVDYSKILKTEDVVKQEEDARIAQEAKLEGAKAAAVNQQTQQEQ